MLDESLHPLPQAELGKLHGDYVYFVGAPNGPIKIGRSSDVRGRLRVLRISSPEEVYCWAVQGPERVVGLVEAFYHDEFHDSRLRGEWFRRTPELVMQVRRLHERYCAKYRLPNPWTSAATEALMSRAPEAAA